MNYPNRLKTKIKSEFFDTKKHKKISDAIKEFRMLSGYSRPYFSLILNGKAVPTYPRMITIARLLNSTPKDIWY